MSNTPKLGRKTANRNRTLRNLLTSLVLYEKLTTTEAKAKAVLPQAERLLNRSRSGSLASRRYAITKLFDDNAVKKLFEDFPERFGTRTSGFVRLTKIAPRPGDGSSMARLEILVTPLEELIAKTTNTKTVVRKRAARKEEPEVETPVVSEPSENETAAETPSEDNSK